MKIIEKKELLSRNIWTIQEVQNYFNITPNKWSKVRQYIKKRPPFSSSVYRDDVLEILNTSVDKEWETIKKIEN